MNNMVKFKEKTDELFYKFDGYSATELELMVEKYVNDKILEYNLDVVLRDVVLSGSRCRGLEYSASDLDFVVSFLGKEREDVLFAILNEDEFDIDGVKVDINPIIVEKTGSLDEYLLGVEEYLKELYMQRNAL